MTVDSLAPAARADARREAPDQQAALTGAARDILLALSGTFDERSSDSRRRIRELAESDWRLFYAGALEVLKIRHDSACGIYLVKMLMGRNLLIDALCDPALSREQALAVARVASRIDTMTDVNLAKFLADREGSSQAIRPAELMRLMEIMVEISTSVRILPALKRMARHPDAHVRSKAVLMIGRGDPASGWLQNRFAEPDPRIRANTVEALWGVDTADARHLLMAAARDDNNRVAGNALLALYRLGEPSAGPDLRKMSERESAAFRATAAWAMGETADSEFSPALARLMGDSSQMVRKRAFSALGKIAAARARQAAHGGPVDR